MTPEIMPSKSPASESKISYTFPAIALLVVVLAGLFYFLYQKQHPATSISTNNLENPTPPTVTNSVKLATGKQIYKFSHGPNVKGPKIQSFTIDPLDPQMGDTQNLIVKMSSTSLLSKASINVYTDNKVKEIGLKFTGGDLASGTYEGSWVVDDTYETNYAFRFILTDKSGTYDNVMSPR